MESIDLLVLRQLNAWRQASQHAVLVTVLQTWGSSPRPVGAMMAIREDGRVVGSVSGGCIEDDLIRQFSQTGALAAQALQLPQRRQYGVSAEEAHRFGLPCGGTIELLLEYNPKASQLRQLLDQLDQGMLMTRSLHLTTGTVRLQQSIQSEALYFDDEWLHVGFGPRFRMLLIGAGQLSEYLATMALFNGFEVTVCDPRHQYHQGWAVDKVQLVTGMPDDEVVTFGPDPRSCIIALTHDPKLDDLALLEALASPAFYVGAIGSRKNHALRRARMIEHLEQTEQSLAKLKGPIGIYIGSKTPAEIAVSIMAEVIAYKNKVVLPSQLNVQLAKDHADRVYEWEQT
ncbi:XdhC family protein [Paenalcaligenes hominis]|uniref:XdhC family protein n=1 Tax=Paenalcaligenes hominis TaxID=643674 RepID=UPI003523A9AD